MKTSKIMFALEPSERIDLERLRDKIGLETTSQLLRKIVKEYLKNNLYNEKAV